MWKFQTIMKSQTLENTLRNARMKDIVVIHKARDYVTAKSRKPTKGARRQGSIVAIVYSINGASSKKRNKNQE
jgi:hypothetical protein